MFLSSVRDLTHPAVSGVLYGSTLGGYQYYQGSKPMEALKTGGKAAILQAGSSMGADVLTAPIKNLLPAMYGQVSDNTIRPVLTAAINVLITKLMKGDKLDYKQLAMLGLLSIGAELATNSSVDLLIKQGLLAPEPPKLAKAGFDQPVSASAPLSGRSLLRNN
jgi:hypothetical protein